MKKEIFCKILEQFGIFLKTRESVFIVAVGTGVHDIKNSFITAANPNLPSSHRIAGVARGAFTSGSLITSYLAQVNKNSSLGLAFSICSDCFTIGYLLCGGNIARTYLYSYPTQLTKF